MEIIPSSRRPLPHCINQKRAVVSAKEKLENVVPTCVLLLIAGHECTRSFKPRLTTVCICLFSTLAEENTGNTCLTDTRKDSLRNHLSVTTQKLWTDLQLKFGI